MIKKEKARTIIQIHDIQGWGGAERVACLMETTYERHGHTVIDFYGKKTLTSPIRRVYNTKDKKRLEEILDANDVTFAHIHNIHEALGPSILKPLRERGIRTIATLHDYHFICPVVTMDCGEAKNCTRCDLERRGWRLPLDKLQASVRDDLLDTIDTFVCPSRFLLERFYEVFELRDRLVHIPNGVFIDDFTPSYPEQARTFYFGGKIAFHKGVKDLLRAFEDLQEDMKDARLLISGDGKDRVWVENYIRKHELGKVVEYVGMLPEDFLNEFRSNVDIAILPSLWPENASIFLLEMMALRKPVIASNAGGNVEIVTHKRDGLTYEAGHLRELEDAIWTMYDQPKIVQDLAKAARQTIEYRFNIEKIYEQYEELLQNGAGKLRKH